MGGVYDSLKTSASLPARDAAAALAAASFLEQLTSSQVSSLLWSCSTVTRLQHIYIDVPCVQTCLQYMFAGICWRGVALSAAVL